MPSFKISRHDSAAMVNHSWLVCLLFVLLAPLAVTAESRRVVIYEQTYYLNGGDTVEVSLLPLIANSDNIPVTHVLLSSIHIVDEFNGIELNDFAPEDPFFDNVWKEAKEVQEAGVIVMAMVGGASPGSWDRLDGSDEDFEYYYTPLRDFVTKYEIQGLDLDVEQPMSLDGILRLVDRLRADFGEDFVISMAPVASALWPGGGNLSGFSYFDLEALRGDNISFYNAQFYNNWGDAGSTDDYYEILDNGTFRADKVVMGMLTNGANGEGFIPVTSDSKQIITQLSSEVADFGGVAGWEYFNSLPGNTAAPSEWAFDMASYMADGLANPTTRQERAALSAPEKVVRTVTRAAGKAWSDLLAYI